MDTWMTFLSGVDAAERDSDFFTPVVACLRTNELEDPLELEGMMPEDLKDIPVCPRRTAFMRRAIKTLEGQKIVPAPAAPQNTQSVALSQEVLQALMGKKERRDHLDVGSKLATVTLKGLAAY